MQNMLDLVLEKHNKEIELLKYKHKEEVALIEKDLNEKHSEEINKLKVELSLANHIKWDKSKRYFSLKDFCRNMRDILFIKEDSLKRFYYEEGILKQENDKYVPNTDLAILVDNELYMDYSLLREMLAIRSLVFFGEGDVMKDMMDNYNSSKELITERLGETVYTQCKQRSVEFKSHRENVYCITGGNK